MFWYKILIRQCYYFLHVIMNINNEEQLQKVDALQIQESTFVRIA